MEFSPQRAPYDIGAMLDTGAWSTFQKLVVAFAAFAIILDGFDGQMIGFAIPVLIREWGVTRGDFAAVVVAGLVGMGIGSAFAGLIADRFGRRVAVILSVVLFALTTVAIGFAPDLRSIAILRFIAGLGIGGALPCATTMSAEFTPARHRPLAVTATIVCVPLGGALAGVFAGAIMPHFGWRGLFWGGGLLSLALAGGLVWLLPESPRFLARRPTRWGDLSVLLQRMGMTVVQPAMFNDIGEQSVETSAGVGALFVAQRWRDTVGLGLSYALSLLAVYTAFSWLPTLLASEGLSVAIAGDGLTAYNFGGVFGALICAAAITRFGSRWPLALCCAGAALTALVLRGQTEANVLIVLIGVHGMFVNAVQSTMNAVTAHCYPTNVRATGAAFALVCGRLGAILSGVIGAWVITKGGGGGYFGLLAAAMTGALLTLMLVRHHVPRSHRGGGAAWGLLSPPVLKK